MISLIKNIDISIIFDVYNNIYFNNIIKITIDQGGGEIT